MFYKKRIEELENEVKRLNSKILDTERSLRIQTNLYLNNPILDSIYGHFVAEVERKISVSNVLEMLLRDLGYEIVYDYEPESESYTLKKTPIPQKKAKKK